MNRLTRLGSEALYPATRAFTRSRRRNPETRASLRAAAVDSFSSRDQLTGSYEPVEQILSEILRSAMDVAVADQGFILVSREGSVLEVASSRNIRPAEVMDVVLARAASPIHSALREGRLSAIDSRGHTMPVFDGYFEANAPAILCLPMDLGLRQSGTLCLVRKPSGARKLSELDIEIVQALAEQAALAVGAACNQSALSRLEASLSDLMPALS